MAKTIDIKLPNSHSYLHYITLGSQSDLKVLWQLLRLASARLQRVTVNHNARDKKIAPVYRGDLAWGSAKPELS